MTVMERAESFTVSRRKNIEMVSAAVHRHSSFSRRGISERLFTFAFSNLVYPQIWEDPVVDLEAMQLEPGHRMLAIASGGCNVLSYLTAAPVAITAVDLNSSHVALNRLKYTAAAKLDYDDFSLLFRDAASKGSIAVFDKKLAPYLDDETRQFWSRRDGLGRRRIEVFSRGFYQYGLLGRFIGAAHRMARLLGANPRRLIEAKTIEEQRDIFESELRPLFNKTLVRKLLSKPSALFGLGIPPTQFEALAGGKPMHDVLVERLERLACGFPIASNYFAWQAFNRGYSAASDGPLPPYLESRNFETLKSRVDGVSVFNRSLEDHLTRCPARRIDRYVLLDAQDWMSDSQLNVLWREITRTARPGARVIFRTAGKESVLPGRVRASVLDQWVYKSEKSIELSLKDRSAIYGGFHLYERAD